MKGGSAGAIVLNTAGEVLLVHHTYGVQNWEIPGGAGEAKESPSETAVREVYEETGLRVRAVRATGWYYEPEIDKLGTVFLCVVETGSELTPVPDGSETSECKFWPADSLPRPISDWTVLRISDALNGQSMPLPTVIGPRKWL